MKKIVQYVGLLPIIMVLLLTSCVKQEYDLNNFNGDITIASGGLEIPIGSTERLTIQDFLDSTDVDFFSKDPDGGYFINQKGVFSVSDELPDFFGPEQVEKWMKLEDLVYSKSNLYKKSEIVLPPFIGEEDYAIPDGILPSKSLDKLIYDVSFDFDLPDQVKSINEIVLNKGGMIRVSIAINDPFIAKGELTPAIDVDLSEFFIIDGKKEPIHLSELVLNEKNNYSATRDYSITDISFDPREICQAADFVKTASIEGYVSLKGAVTNRAVFEASENMSIELKVSFIDVGVSKVDANLDYSTDEFTKAVNLSQLPEFLRSDNVCLDLDNPYIVLDFDTNIGIPMSGNINLSGYHDGVPMPAQRVEIDFSLPYSASADNVTSSTLWIGGKNKGVPADVTFIEANIAGLIKSVPDSILVTFTGNIDNTKSSVIEVNADYMLDLEYDFVLPFAFGENFKVAITDTIDVDESGIGDILKAGKVKLLGAIDNSFPLKFDMKVEMLDEDGNLLTADPVKQAITPCNYDGTASNSLLNMEIAAKSGVDMTKLAKMCVTFEVTSKEASGIPITDKCYVQAKLGLSFPEGIRLNISGDEE